MNNLRELNAYCQFIRKNKWHPSIQKLYLETAITDFISVEDIKNYRFNEKTREFEKIVDKIQKSF